MFFLLRLPVEPISGATNTSSASPLHQANAAYRLGRRVEDFIYSSMAAAHLSPRRTPPASHRSPCAECGLH